MCLPNKGGTAITYICKVRDFNVKVEFKAFHIGLKHVGKELAKYISSR